MDLVVTVLSVKPASVRIACVGAGSGREYWHRILPVHVQQTGVSPSGFRAFIYTAGSNDPELNFQLMILETETGKQFSSQFIGSRRHVRFNGEEAISQHTERPKAYR